MTSDAIFTFIVATLVLLFVVGIATVGRLLSLLRDRHPDVWLGLGSPTLFLNNSIQNGLRLERFIWRKEYAQLGDKDLERLARFVRGLFVVYAVAFVAFIALQVWTGRGAADG